MRADTIVIKIGLRLDRKTRRDFRAHLDSVLGDHRIVILDASELTGVDSAGLGEIFTLVVRLMKTNGEVWLCGASPPMQAIFSLVQMSRVAKVYPESAEEVLAAMEAAPAEKGAV